MAGATLAGSGSADPITNGSFGQLGNQNNNLIGGVLQGNPSQTSLMNLFGGSMSGSQATNTPVSMTPPAYAALQSPIAGQLLSLFGGGPVYGGVNSAGLPMSSAPQATTPNTFSAAMSPQESTLLSTIMGNGGQVNPALTSAQNFVTNATSPGFLSPATNPALAAAISGAVNPMVSAFQNVTMPNLASQFVANGQVLNGPAQVGNNPASGQGSSAFDKAAAIAGTGLTQGIGQVTGQLESQAMAEQPQAAAQAPGVSSAELNNLMSTLQAEALPRLIQQYGMDQGLQQFNNRVNVMLQALGVGANISGPDVAQQAQSSSQSTSSKGAMADIMGMF